MQKILVICGPTATGKTALALRLARKFNGEVVSTDSRQVYKDMDIGTGKDLSPHVKHQTHLPGERVPSAKLGGFYKVKGIPIWGYDLVNFNEEFSVHNFVVIAKRIIRHIQKRNKLPILVGGTGLYIKGVIDGISWAGIPRNNALRMRLKKSSREEIFELLKKSDPAHASSLNPSDRKNTRRLIRALEIVQAKKTGSIKGGLAGIKKNNSVLFCGLFADKETLHANIKKRVLGRINAGFEKEIKKLIKKGFLHSPQALNTLGYSQWITNNLGKGSTTELVSNWTHAEQKYAKRQITWFKKDTRINWYNIENKIYEKEIENMIRKWYHNRDETSGSKSRAVV